MENKKEKQILVVFTGGTICTTIKNGEMNTDSEAPMALIDFYKKSDSFCKDKVHLKKGEEFIIYIPDIKTKYPDFIAEKWSLSDIQSFCDNYGLKIETEEVSVAPSAGYSDGEIMETNKAKGSDIIKGTTLRVKVAKVVKVTPSPSPSPSASPSPEPSSSPSTE